MYILYRHRYTCKHQSFYNQYATNYLLIQSYVQIPANVRLNFHITAQEHEYYHDASNSLLRSKIMYIKLKKLQFMQNFNLNFQSQRNKVEQLTLVNSIRQFRS